MLAAATSYARNVFSAWTVQVTLYVIAGLMGLIGLLFFVVAGHVVLSRRFEPEVAALMIGGGFLLLAGVILLAARLRARRPAPGNDLARLALASSAASMTVRTLTSARGGSLGATLATGSIGLVGALIMLAKRAVSGASPSAADKAEEATQSTSEAAGALASAVGRSARQAASSVRSTWDDYQPELRSRAASVQREVPRLVEAALPALAGMLRPEPRRWWLLWRQRPASPLERLANAFEGRERLAATVAGAIALAVIASWMSDNKDS